MSTHHAAPADRESNVSAPDVFGGTSFSRRTVMAGVAWSGPVVVVATSAPAYATSSTTSLTATTPATPDVSWAMAASTRVMGAVLLDNGVPITGAQVTFALSGTTWLRLAQLTATTDSNGLAVSNLTAVTGATPAPGAVTTLTATHQDLTVTWTLSYRPFATLATGHNATHALALADGKVYAWGNNASGQLGDGGGVRERTIPRATAPGDIPTDVQITAIAAGLHHSLALGDDGHVYAWGGNTYGQLGDGSSTIRRTPVATAPGDIPADVQIIAIAAGTSHSLALGNDGHVYSWGRNQNAQLGDGTRSVNRLTPVATSPGAIPSGVKITAISAGNFHSLALGDDGYVYGWGSGYYGQLGVGTSGTVHLTPVATAPGDIPADVQITAIAAGAQHSLALGDDGHVYAWGYNHYGQLGNDTTTDRSTPVATSRGDIPAGVKITAIASGPHQGLALGDDGHVYAWGNNDDGQLGDGTSATNRLTPVATAPGDIPADVQVTAVSAATANSYALTSQGFVYAWGSTTLGRLGNGTPGFSSALLPVQVAVVPLP